MQTPAAKIRFSSPWYHTGEAIRIAWRGVSSQDALPPGQYRAFGEPQLIFSDFGFLSRQELAFEIMR